MVFEIEHIITQIIAFVIMLWVLKRFAWKPLLDVMHQRTEKIRSEFEAIEEKQKEVEKMALEYSEKLDGIKEESRHLIQEAIKQSRQVAHEIQKATQEHANDIIKKAFESSQREIEKAKIDLRTDIVNMAASLFEKLVKTKIDDKKNEKLIKQLMDEVEFK